MKNWFSVYLLSALYVTSTLAISNNGDHYHTHLLAYYHQKKNQPHRADYYYTYLLKLNPSIFIYPSYFQHLFVQNSFNKIATLAPLVESSAAYDTDTRVIIGQSLEALGNHQAAQNIFISLSQDKDSIKNPLVAYNAASAHVRNNNPHEALSLINNYLLNTSEQPGHCMFYFLRAQTYLIINDKNNALQSIKKSVELYPEFEQGWLLFGLLQELAGNIDDAIKGYTHCLGLLGHNPSLEQALATLHLQKKAINTQHQNVFDRAHTAYSQKKYQDALQLIDQSLALMPQDTASKLLKIEILLSLKHYQTAINLLTEWATTSENPEPWLHSLHLLYQNTAYQKEIIKALHSIVTNSKNSLPALLYLSDLYIRNKQYPNALTSLSKALRTTQNNTIRAQISLQKSIIYYNQRRWDLMVNELERTLQINDHSVPALNLLAYHYASKGHDLAKAQQLIAQALAQEPHNPHLLDTQALILYKQKKYPQAQRMLLDALTKEPYDYFILKHLAKVLYQMGDQKAAANAVQKSFNYAKNPEQKEKLQTLLAKWNI